MSALTLLRVYKLNAEMKQLLLITRIPFFAKNKSNFSECVNDLSQGHKMRHLHFLGFILQI